MVTATEDVRVQTNARASAVRKLVDDSKLRATVRAEVRSGHHVVYSDAPGGLVSVVDVEGQQQLRLIGDLQREAEGIIQRECLAELVTERREAEQLANTFEVGGKRVPLLNGCQMLSVAPGTFVGVHIASEGRFLVFGSNRPDAQTALRSRWPDARFDRLVFDGRRFVPNLLSASAPVPAAEVEARLTKVERAAIDALPEHLQKRAVLSLEVARLVDLVRAVPRPKRHEHPAPAPAPVVEDQTVSPAPPYPPPGR